MLFIYLFIHLLLLFIWYFHLKRNVSFVQFYHYFVLVFLIVYINYLFKKKIICIYSIYSYFFIFKSYEIVIYFNCY